MSSPLSIDTPTYLLRRRQERLHQGENKPQQRAMPCDGRPHRPWPHRHPDHPAILPAVTPRQLRRVQDVAKLAPGVGLPLTPAPRHLCRVRYPSRPDFVLGSTRASG